MRSDGEGIFPDTLCFFLIPPPPGGAGKGGDNFIMTNEFLML